MAARASLRNIKFVRSLNQVSSRAFQRQNAMEETMCDYSLETYRSRPAQLGEKYETHQFPSFSIGFIAPGDPSTAVCMARDTKLRLEGIPEKVQRSYFLTRNEDVTFTRKTVHITMECASPMVQKWRCERSVPV
jgi:hypothetical protein